MNFMDFSEIYFDFLRNFFAFISLLKITKRVVFSHKTRGADMAHDGHVARPCEPT